MSNQCVRCAVAAAPAPKGHTATFMTLPVSNQSLVVGGSVTHDQMFGLAKRPFTVGAF